MWFLLKITQCNHTRVLIALCIKHFRLKSLSYRFVVKALRSVKDGISFGDEAFLSAKESDEGYTIRGLERVEAGHEVRLQQLATRAAFFSSVDEEAKEAESQACSVGAEDGI